MRRLINESRVQKFVKMDLKYQNGKNKVKVSKPKKIKK